MNKAQRLLDEALAPRSSGPAAALHGWRNRRALRQLVAESDPLVQYTLDGTRLWMPLSHQLPLIRRDHPGYSRNAGRIAKCVIEAHPGTAMIDIGANIGDTVAIVRSQVHCPVLCIEGNPKFLEVLEMNLAALGTDVHVEPCYVGAEDGAISGTVETQKGSATIAASDTQTIRMRTLRAILDNHPRLGRASLLKIDTDGFDGHIIRGAADVLARHRPALFFEYDPYFLVRANDEGLSLFPFLEGLGYDSALVYDNFGRFMLLGHCRDAETWRDLHAYHTGRGSSLYMDICVMHRDDVAVAQKLRTLEHSPASLAA